jgi:hypothetical protein
MFFGGCVKMSVSEGCPVTITNIAELWAYNRPVLDELQTVVEPLATELAAYVDADIARGDGVTRETLATRTQHTIPFGAPFTLLPPRLFGGLYEDIGVPRLPQDASEAQQLVASYRQRAEAPPREDMPTGTYTTTPEAHMEKLLADLLWMQRQGVVIDPARWERYRQVAREQAEHGRYDMDISSVNRGNSIKSMYHYAPLARLVHAEATGAFDHYLSMPTVALDIDGPSLGLAPVGYLYMPEGAYGPQFSEKLLRTTAYMIQSAQRALGARARQLAHEHPDIIARNTTRGHEGRSLDATLISTAQEGARSTMEVIALLTADKVRGYDDPDRLVEAIIEQGIIEEFTRAIPMGLLGPLLFTGKYFPNLLLHTGSGKLALNPFIMQEIKKAKRAMALQDMAAWAQYWSLSEEDRQAVLPPVATSLICPAALPHGALTRMNRALLRAYQAVRQ